MRTAMTEYIKGKKIFPGLIHLLLNMKPTEVEATHPWMELCKEVGEPCQFDQFSLKDALLLNLSQHTQLKKLRGPLFLF